MKKIFILLTALIVLCTSVDAFAQTRRTTTTPPRYQPKSATKSKPKTPPKPHVKVPEGLNMLEVPYISTYWVEPIVSPKDDVLIKFYLTDWNQSEYRLGDDSFTFDAEVEFGLLEGGKNPPKTLTKQKIKAGDHEFNLGRLPEGEYYVALKGMDMYGRRSNVLFNEFLVRAPEKGVISDKETYVMTQGDLMKYAINNQGDYGILELIELAPEERAGAAGIIENRMEYAKVPAGKYLILAMGTDGKPALGNWKNCKVIYSSTYDKNRVEDESAKNGNALNQFIKDIKEKGYRKLVLLPGTYRISHTNTIMIPDRFTLDMNGAILKLNQFTGSGATMMNIRDAYDSHVINGIVEGDYFEHDYAGSEKNSEWVSGIDISGESKYSSYDNVTVRYITGYGVMNGFHGNHVQPKGAGKFVKGGIDYYTGELDPETPDVCSSEYIDIKTFIPTKYVAVSKYLGYQGMATNSWYFTAYFYDAEKKFIEAIDAFQYRIIKIPEGALFMRITVAADDPEKIPEQGLTLTRFKLPWNCWFKGLKIMNARCVGMAQAAMRNFLVEDCEFSRSGESGAFCAYDAEDGWDMMQDITIRGNKFFENFRNDFLTCGGHNFVVENNEGRIHLWDRTKSTVVRNNRFKDGTFLSGNRNRTMLPRIENNTFEGGVRLGGDSNDWYIVMKGPLKATGVSCGTGGMLANVTIDGGDYQRICAIDSTIKNAKINFAGSKFIRCKLEDLSGHTNGAVDIIDSELKNLTSAINQPSDVRIVNSKLENVQYSFGYWTKPGKLSIVNSSVKNTGMPFIRTPAYSIGEFKIEKADISTGTAPAIEIYDLRAQETDTQEGIVSITESKFENSKGFVITSSGNASAKSILFYDVKNKLAKDMIFNDSSKWPEIWKVLTAFPKVVPPKGTTVKKPGTLTPPRTNLPPPLKKDTKTTTRTPRTKDTKKK